MLGYRGMHKELLFKPMRFLTDMVAAESVFANKICPGKQYHTHGFTRQNNASFSAEWPEE